MGILHSIARTCLGGKTEDEENSKIGPFYHTYPLHHQKQNHNPCNGSDTSRFSDQRSLTILSFHSFIFKAIKGLLQKVRFVSYLPRPSKRADDPILPVQNPAPTLSTSDDDPSLVLPLIIYDSSSDSTTEIAIVADSDSSEDVDVVSCENKYSTNRKQMDCVIIPIPADLMHSLACTTASQEIVDSAVVTEEDMAVGVKSAEERVINVKSEVGVKSAEEKVIDVKSKVGVKSAEEKVINVKSKVGVKSAEEKVINVKSKVGVKSSRAEEKVINVKCKVGLVGEDEGIRWIKHYSSHHWTLLVGEGDFSFSACLALAFGWALNIIATSLDSEAFLKENYGNAVSNIKELRSRGSKVMHGIDATKMADHARLRHLKFDRIVYNFPFAGFFKDLSRKNQLRRHRRLVSQFMKNAKEMMSENGEIHISHKTNDFHNEWNLESIASSHGLGLIEAVPFSRYEYSGYNTKFGFGGDNNFNYNPAKTYKFRLKSLSY